MNSVKETSFQGKCVSTRVPPASVVNTKKAFPFFWLLLGGCFPSWALQSALGRGHKFMADNGREGGLGGCGRRATDACHKLNGTMSRGVGRSVWRRMCSALEATNWGP